MVLPVPASKLAEGLSESERDPGLPATKDPWSNMSVAVRVALAEAPETEGWLEVHSPYEHQIPHGSVPAE